MINIPCGNEPLTTPECSPDCDEAIRELRERIGEMTDKLNTIEEGAQVNPPIDNSMSNSSPNAVENQVITQYVNEYGIALGSDAPLVGGAIVGDAVLGGATSLVLERPDGTEDSVDIQGSGAVSVSAQNDVLTIDVPTGIIAQLEAGLDTTNRAWAADVLHDWLETRIAQIPADQFLDLAKTTFVNPFTWSNVLYPGSIDPNLDGKPVLVLALTDGTNTTYSFLNMEDLVDGGGGTSITVTLASASWSSDTQTVTATGVTASSTVIISPAPSNIDDYGDAGIYCSAQGSNSLTFACATTPSNDITVNVLILGSGGAQGGSNSDLALTDDIVLFDREMTAGFMQVLTNGTFLGVVPLSLEINNGDVFDIYVSQTNLSGGSVTFGGSVLNQNRTVGTGSYLWAQNVESIATTIMGNPMGIMKNTQANREKIFVQGLDSIQSTYRDALLSAPTLAFIATPQGSGTTISHRITIFKK